MSDFGVNFKQFFTDFKDNLQSDDSSTKAKAAIALGLSIANPLSLLLAGVIKGLTGTSNIIELQGTDTIAISNEDAVKTFSNNSVFNEEDYLTDIEERPWQEVDISSLTDLSLLDNPEIFPKEKIYAMIAHYTLGDQELTPEIKEYLEKKTGVTINDPPSDETPFSSINSQLTPNIMKTFSDSQLSMLLHAYNEGTQQLDEFQLKYIELRGIGVNATDSESTTEEGGAPETQYQAFNPNEISLEEFKATYSTNEQLEEIANKYKEGIQSLSPDMKAYIEETLGKTIEDYDYTALDLTNMSIDDFSALNYDNYQLETLVAQYQNKGLNLPQDIMNYITEKGITIDTNNPNTQESSVNTDNEVKSDSSLEEIPDIPLSDAANPFAVTSSENSKITTITQESLFDIQKSTLEEYISTYEQTPDLIEFADEHTKNQFLQLYNEYKEQYRKESEDLPEEVKNKLEANAGGTSTT